MTKGSDGDESGTRTRSKRHLGTVSIPLVGLVAMTCLSIGVLVTVLFLPEPTPSSLIAPADSGSMTVSSETYDGAREGTAALVVSSAQVLRSPGDGVVTATRCETGGTVASGTSLMSINGGPILSLATSVPLWRDLAHGDKGVDVSAVQAELVRLGHQISVTGAYDEKTRVAVRTLFEALGEANPTGTLPLSRVMWLPLPEVVITSCTAGASDPVSSGEIMASLAGSLRSLTVINPPGEDGWVVWFGDSSAPMDVDGHVTDSEFFATVEASPEFREVSAPGSSLELPIRIALAVPLDALTVPASAVIATGQGVGCVIEDGVPVPVVILSSTLGKTMVSVTDGKMPSHVDIRPDPTTDCS